MSYVSSDDGNSDTIHVASALVLDESDNDNPLRMDEQQERDSMRRVRAEAEKASYNGKGKGRVSTSLPASGESATSQETSDASTSDEGSDVEEYIFTAEDDEDEMLAEQEIRDFSDDEYEIDDDAKSHISLSSDIEEDGQLEVSGLDSPKWDRMTLDERLMWESQFGQIFEQPIHGSWNVTEDWHRSLDEHMFRYAAVFPFAQWVSDKITVQSWLKRVSERHEWRQNFGRVYNRPTRPSQQLRLPQTPYTGAYAMGAPVPLQRQRANVPPSHNVSMPPGSHSFLGHGQYNVQHMHGLGAITGHLPMPSHGDPAYLPMQPHPDLDMRPHSAGTIKSSSSRNKKSSPAPPPTPPYPLRERPEDKKAPPKTSRGTKRHKAEADDFPWNRDFDYVVAKIAAQQAGAWDMSIYDISTLRAMRAVRAHNAPIVEVLEGRITEKQKSGRVAKRTRDAQSDPVTDDGDEGPAQHQTGGRQTNTSPNLENSALVGNFAYASQADRRAAEGLKLPKSEPDFVIAAGEGGKVSMAALANIKIHWSPGNKGPSQSLSKAIFSVKDAVLTSKQLRNTDILNQTAAECIIDFRPDLIWRNTLIRILSEGNMSNKEIRGRLLLNGANSDRATITKRLGAALGNNTSTVKGNDYNAEVKFVTWANANRRDYQNYQSFFGKHPPPVHPLPMPQRPIGMVLEISSDVEEGPSRKKLKLDLRKGRRKGSEVESEVLSSAVEEHDVQMVNAGTSVQEDMEQEAGAEEDEDEDEVGAEEDDEDKDDDEDDDAVSVQDSEVLDDLSD